MFNFSIFGGHTGQLSSDRRLYCTIFGSCDLRRPTVIKQVLEARRLRDVGQPAPLSFFVTLFGGTVIKAATVAQEFLDLQDAIRTGLLSFEDVDVEVARLGAGGWRTGSLTLFGSLQADELPSEDQELEELALNRHLGYLPDEPCTVLMRAVGQRGSARSAIVRQAVTLLLRQPTTVA